MFAGAVRADPAAGRLQVPQQASTIRAGATRWDWALFVGGFVPALIFGVAFGNVLQGVPFRFDDRHAHHLRRAASSACSIRSRCCAAWRQRRHAGDARRRLAGAEDAAARWPSARAACGSVAAVATIVLYALAGVLLWSFVDGYRDHQRARRRPGRRIRCSRRSSACGAWFTNYGAHPWLYDRAGARLAGALLALLGMRMRAELMTLRGQRPVDRRHRPERRRLDVPVHPAVDRSTRAPA